MHFDTITELLSIPNHKVTKIVQNTRVLLELVLEPVKDVMPICSGCGRVHNTPIHSRGYTVVEDLPITGRRVFLHVCKRKTLCPEDGRIRVEEFDWMSKRFTWGLRMKRCIGLTRPYWRNLRLRYFILSLHRIT